MATGSFGAAGSSKEADSTMKSIDSIGSNCAVTGSDNCVGVIVKDDCMLSKDGWGTAE